MLVTGDKLREYARIFLDTLQREWIIETDDVIQRSGERFEVGSSSDHIAIKLSRNPRDQNDRAYQIYYNNDQLGTVVAASLFPEDEMSTVALKAANKLRYYDHESCDPVGNISQFREVGTGDLESIRKELIRICDADNLFI